MKGFKNYIKYLEGKVVSIEGAKTKGRLYHIKNKGYPALCGGEDDVYGELITINTDGNIIKQLDVLESYNEKQEILNEYNRYPIEISVSHNNNLVMDAYIYNLECLANEKDELIYIPYGDWRRYLKLIN